MNLEEALRRTRNRPIDVERDVRLGGTAFDKLDVSLVLDQGRARVEHGVLTSRGVTAELSGLIDLEPRIPLFASTRCRRTQTASNRNKLPA